MKSRLSYVAGLCDYKVKRVEDEQGQNCDSRKIASRSGALTIHLEPSTKAIWHLRDLFPRSIVVGVLLGSRPTKSKMVQSPSVYAQPIRLAAPLKHVVVLTTIGPRRLPTLSSVSCFEPLNKAARLSFRKPILPGLKHLLGAYYYKKARRQSEVRY
jgi:hypothetical protein